MPTILSTLPPAELRALAATYVDSFDDRGITASAWAVFSMHYAESEWFKVVPRQFRHELLDAAFVAWRIWEQYRQHRQRGYTLTTAKYMSADGRTVFAGVTQEWLTQRVPEPPR